MPKPVTFTFDDIEFSPSPGPATFVWRKIVALIRRPNHVVLTPSVDQFQPNDVAVAVFSGSQGAPSGWTQLPNSPGVFYRTWSADDV